MLDRIAKKTLNIILLVDTSKSMGGERIKQVNEAIVDIQDYLKNLQVENTDVNFDLTLIPFSTTATFYNDTASTNVDDFHFNGLKTGGQTNLHLAYEKLETILKSKHQGGIMPDFGGLAPVILLLSDGHPTLTKLRPYIDRLENRSWFDVALKFAIAIGLNDNKTMRVLSNFTRNKETVLHCINSESLKQIIKLIVVTSSVVKSEQATNSKQTEEETQRTIIQTIHNGIDEVVEWGW